MSEPPELATFADVDRGGDARRLVEWLDEAHGMELFRLVKSWTFELAGAAAGARVLDIGCGTGEDVRAIGTLVGESGLSVGADRSEAMVAEACGRAPGGALVACDACALAFADGAFDGVRAERVLVHVDDPACAVGEMFRVVRPGGRVVCFEADMETLVVDAPDRETTRRVLNAFCDGLRSGWIGRRLYGYFAAAGAMEVEVHPVTLVLTDLAVANRFWTLEQTCERAAREGAIALDAAAAWVASLGEADRAGRFFCAVTGFLVVGRRG